MEQRFSRWDGRTDLNDRSLIGSARARSGVTRCGDGNNKQEHAARKKFACSCNRSMCTAKGSTRSTSRVWISFTHTTESSSERSSREIYPSIYQSCMSVRPNARARRHCPSGRSGWSARNGRPPASMDQQLLAIIQRDGNALASVSSRAASIRHASLPAALVDPLVSSAAPRPGGEAGGQAVLACTQHVSPARRFRTSTTIVFINPQFLCLCGPGPGPS